MCVCVQIFVHRCMCVFVSQSQAAFTSPSGAVLSLNSRSSAKAVPYTPGYRLALDSIGVSTTSNIVAKPAAAHTPDYMLALDSIGVKAPQSSATSPTVVTSSYQAALASVGAKPISTIANSVGSTPPPAASVVGSITPAPKPPLPSTPVFTNCFASFTVAFILSCALPAVTNMTFKILYVQVQWQCATCTYLNPAHFLACEICARTRPVDGFVNFNRILVWR